MVGVVANTAMQSHCMLCGKPGAVGTSCSSCFVPLPNPAAETRGPFMCPRCSTPLEKLGAGSGAVIHACRACSGFFVPPRAWSNVLTQRSLADRVEAQVPRRTIDRGAFVPLLKCPACRAEMDRGRFAATSSVVIDACPHQHGIWLDAGELPEVVRYAEHRSKISALRAQDESERQWARETGRDPLLLSIESEQERVRAEKAQKMWRAKKAGMVIGGTLLAVRLAFYVWRFTIAKNEQAESAETEEQVVKAVSGGQHAAGPTGR